MKKRSKFMNQLPNIVLGLVFLIGLGIFLYPSVSDLINEWLQSKEISGYKHSVSQLSTEACDKMIQDAQVYNEGLVGKNLAANIDNIPNTNYSELLSIDAGKVMAYLTIDKIGVKLPIYHGTDADVLQNGIGHLAGSSLPVRGESVHTVISGHTGLPSSKLLTDLVELKVGDEFRINVLNQRYVYEVDQILVVEPDDTDALEIVENHEYATIVTCTPYGVNTHRLLVRGHLVDNVLESDVTGDALVVDSNVVTIIIAVPLAVILFIILIRLRKNKKEEENDDEEDIV